MARTNAKNDQLKPADDSIASIKYTAKRKNLPPAGLEYQGVLKDAPKIRCEYNPHLPPVLRSAADALRRHEPWLEWSGKREKPWFEVEPVALHMHERVSTQAILRVLARLARAFLLFGSRVIINGREPQFAATQ